jgi:DNA end-binding protein Ku
VAPRPYWKGYLNLSLVSCPIALTPAPSSSEKFSCCLLEHLETCVLGTRLAQGDAGTLIEGNTRRVGIIGY